MKKAVLKTFPIFTGKQLCWSLFFHKFASQVCNFIEKESLTQMFSDEYCANFKKTYFEEHLRTAVSEF